MEHNQVKSSNYNNSRTYRFSSKDNHFYFRKIDIDEMNSRKDIRQMIANVPYRAAENYKENYKKIDPNYQNQAKEYKIDDENLPKIKDSNINPKEICGFLLEDEEGKPVSIILSGISQDDNQGKNLRVMMGTIATAKEHEGKGYFSILFDETVTKIAEDNNNQLPKVLISLRGVTSKGANFDTYLAILKSRNFDIQAIEREIKSPQDIDPKIGYIPHDLNKIITKIDANEDPKTESQRLKIEIEKKPFQAFFFLGSPNMTLQDFTQNQEKRINEKVAKKQILIDQNKVDSSKELENNKNISSNNLQNCKISEDFAKNNNNNHL